MNKYIVPICDIQAGSCWIKTITAKSITECEEKLMNDLIEYYDFDDFDDYHEFIHWLDEQDILVGNIKDIEEI